MCLYYNLRRLEKKIEARKKKVNGGKKRSIRRIYSTYKHSWRWHMNKGIIWVQLVLRKNYNVMNKCYNTIP
jgi:hypothetical protein